MTWNLTEREMIMNKIIEILTESWLVFAQMAPYLIFGFIMAGILSVLISKEWIEKHIGENNYWSVVKSAIFGVPLPICSCSVIPVSASLHRHGASKAATTSFLLSAPQTGVDSIIVTYSMLGPVFALLRPVSALITGLLGGGIVQFLESGRDVVQNENIHPVDCNESCCDTKGRESIIIRIIKYAFITVPSDIGKPLLVGIVIAGLIAAIIPPEYFKDYLTTFTGAGIISVLIMILAGIPVYVCATASIPIAIGLIHAGVPAGAAMAFLIAGPATNAAAFTTVIKVLGKRVAFTYLFTVLISALIFGVIINLMPFDNLLIPIITQSHIHEMNGILFNIWPVLLLAMIVYSFIPKKNNREIDTVVSSMNTKFYVKGMTCEHCSSSVQRAMNEISNTSNTMVDLKTGEVIIQKIDIDSKLISKIISEIGFEVYDKTEQK
jgi:uncharacterized protein